MTASLRAPLVPVDPDGLDFGSILRRLRIRAGLSQNQLARHSGIDPAYVNRLERGTAGIGSTPSRRVVLSLWRTLETTAENREQMLVAAGLCPETILRAGGWDRYIGRARQDVIAAIATLDRSLAAAPDDDAVEEE